MNTNSTNSAWCVGSPTEFTEFTEPSAWDVLPRIARIDTDAANFRGCTCLKCTNIARGAPTEQERIACL